MTNKRNGRIKNSIRTCTETNCIKKDCRNYTYKIKSDSIAFSSCMYHPEFKSLTTTPNIGITGVS